MCWDVKLICPTQGKMVGGSESEPSKGYDLPRCSMVSIRLVPRFTSTKQVC